LKSKLGNLQFTLSLVIHFTVILSYSEDSERMNQKRGNQK